MSPPGGRTSYHVGPVPELFSSLYACCTPGVRCKRISAATHAGNCRLGTSHEVPEMTLRKSYRRTTCSRPRIRDSRNVGKDKREADGNHEKREIEDEEEKRDEPNGAPAPTKPGRGKKKKQKRRHGSRPHRAQGRWHARGRSRLARTKGSSRHANGGPDLRGAQERARSKEGEIGVAAPRP